MTDTKIAENWTEDEVFSTWAAPPDPGSDTQDLLRIAMCKRPLWDEPKLRIGVADRYPGQFEAGVMPSFDEAFEASPCCVDLGADDVEVLIAVLADRLADMRSMDSE